MDGDGYLDLVFANHYAGGYNINSYIYWGSATGYSTSARTSLPTHGALDVGLTDLNGDNQPDIIFANYYDGSYNTNSYVYWGNGTQSGFSTANRISLPTHGAAGQAVADFNRDGYLDLTFANQYNGSNYDLQSYIYWGSSSGLTTTNKLALPTEGVSGVLAADLDRDGWADLLFAQYYTNLNGYNSTSNQIYWNSPTGFNTNRVSILPGEGSQGLSAVLPPAADTTSAYGRVVPTLGTQLTTQLVLTMPDEVDLLAPVDITVSARDSAGNIATNYVGEVELTSTDSSASFPVAHGFSLADQGIYTFTNLVFEEAGPQTLVVSDGNLTNTLVVTVDDTLVVIDESITWPERGVTLGTLMVTGTNTILTLQGLTVITATNITVGNGARISVDGQGYAAADGPGAGANAPGGGSGGGGGGAYGGHGGTGRGVGGAGGAVSYGSVYQPNSLGSGGGHGRRQNSLCLNTGAKGGGAIKWVISDTLMNNGIISANGANGTAGCPFGDGTGGGGSGGSIWLDVATLAGTGIIQANGGAGGDSGFDTDGGGGGGGRIALYYQTNEGFAFDTAHLQALGGEGHSAQDGSSGTIYLNYIDPLTSTVQISPTSIPANGAAAGTITVTLRTISGSLITGEPVSLTLKSGSQTTTYINGQPASVGPIDLGLTNANGVATASITSTTSETKTVEAASGVVRLVNPGVVFFDTDFVDAAASTVSIPGSSTVAANGSDTIEVRVTARDKFGNLVPGINTTLATTPTVTISPVNSVTDQTGRATYQISHDQPTQVVISATVNGLEVANTVTATFEGPDLVVTQSGPAEVTAGFLITYTITVANQGPLTATNVVVTNTLPAVASFVTHTGAYSYTHDPAENTVVWQIGTLSPSGTDTFSLQAQVAATATGTITNSLSGSLAEVDLNLANNQAAVATTVLTPAAQLVLNPSGLTTLPVHVGDTQALTVAINNPGTAPLEDVTIQPPPHIDWVAVSPTAIASIGLGETRLFTITASAVATQALGWYRDFITVTTTSSGVDPRRLPLEVYVHPDLVNLTTLVENNLGQPVAGAEVFLQKTDASVQYNEGVLQQPPFYPYAQGQTNANGQLALSQVEVGTYAYTLSAAKHTPNPATGLITITESTTQIVFSDLTALPTLSFTPNPLRVGVLAGGSHSQLVQIHNSGPGHAENFQVQTPADLPWLSSGWPTGVNRLEAGETLTLTLFMTPPPLTSAITYNRYITVTADGIGAPAVLAATIDVTTTNVGDLVFEVAELGSATPLTQATVSLVNQSGRVVDEPGGSRLVYDSYQQTTNASGRVVFEDLPLAEYSYVVRANGFYAESGTVEVLPLAAGGGGSQASIGYTVIPASFATSSPPRLLASPPSRLPASSPRAQGTGGSSSSGNNVQVNLERDPFTYNWTVVETTIQDTYAITVEVTFEAETPTPVLFVSPLVFCPGESAQFLVANAGAFTMTNIKLVPDHSGVTFSPALVNIGDLAPGEVYTGTLGTSGSTDAAPEGGVQVTATYPTSTGSAYKTSSRTQKVCVSPGGGGGGGSSGGNWSWSWDQQSNGESKVVGNYQGSQPTFPSDSASPPAPTNPREQADLTLSGNATLERQAFLATLQLASLSSSPIQDVTVNIRAKDATGATIVNGFAVTPTLPTLLGTLNSAGQSLTGNWTIVPGELGIKNPQGELFTLQAQIVYTQNGVVFTTTTPPKPITVLPQPRIKLTFSHSQPDSQGNFYVQVTAKNQGYGVARNLRLDLDQVTVLGDVDANSRSLIFDLLATTLNGQPQPKAYIFNFGDLPPDTSQTGRWDIRVRAADGLPLQNQRVTRFQVACRHLPYQGLEISSLIVDCGPVKQFFLAGECPFCGLEEKNATVGGPINTGNGNYTYSQSASSVPTVGEPLQLTWSYNSLNSGAFPDLPARSSALGLGWTHNYNLSLDLSSPTKVIFKAAHGTPLNFEIVKDRYEAAPGVRATLTRTEIITGQYVYTLTAANQATYVFTTTGQIIRQLDPQGHLTEFSYDPSTGSGQADRLARVSEPISGRYLDFSYDSEERLSSVTDPANRTTRFGYEVISMGPDQTVSMLTVVTDTRNQVWDYGYTQLSGGQPILSRVTDPDSRLVEATGFDSLGRAITQTYRGENLSIVYYDDGRRAITDGLGRVMTHTYNSEFLLVGTTDALGQGETFALDEAYNRTFNRDKNGNVTRYERTELGLTTAITDALGQITRYEYDNRNNLVKSIDARGNVTTYLYNGQNNLISTTNALGDSTFYTYNANSQQTSVTDENGNITRSGYDAIGQRTVITDALGNTTHYEYDNVGRLVRTIDALGKVTLNEYDGGDNLVTVTENYLPGQPQNYQNEYNLITEYIYDGAGRRLTTTDPLGRVSRNEYDPQGRLLRTIENEHPTVSTQNYLNEYNLITTYEYDAAGNQVAVIDPLGRETHTEYDELNRVQQTIVNYVDGNYSAAAPDEDIITEFGYDDNGNLVETIDTLGRLTRTDYDELNRVRRTIVNYQDGVYSAGQPDRDLITAYTYDQVGNQQTVTDPLGRVTSYSYDDLNRVETITNPLNGTTTYAYDPAGNRTTLTDAENRTITYDYDALNRVVTTTNALNGQTTVAYDPVGNRLSATDANLHTTTFEYDSLYRLRETTDAENQTTSFAYDALGNRLSVTDPENNPTRYTYDSLNRLIEMTNALSGTTNVTYDALGNRLTTTDANNHTASFAYDDLNRLVQVTDPNNLTTLTTYDGLGNRLSVTNGANETTEFAYDQANRLILTRDPLGHETQYQYDGAGNRLAMLDAEDVETRYGYDELNRLVSVTENYADGIYSPGVTDEDVTTGYEYDAVGNRLKVTDARGNETTYLYDDLNRRIELRDPLNHLTQYGYDAVGNRIQLTDANGVVTTFSYDEVNRLISIAYSDATPDVSFTYDQAGNRLTMTDGTGQTSYSYDDLYRLTGVTDGANQTVGYGYDAVGNRTRLTYPDSREVTYSYDDGNRLDTVTDWHNGQFGYDYDVANRLSGLSLPDGVSSSYAYDDAGRLTLLAHETITETLASYTYGLDKVGNRTTLTETLIAVQNVPVGAYLENGGLVVAEAEHFGQIVTGTTHTWLTKTVRSGYSGSAYLQALPDTDALYLSNGPAAEYLLNFTTPGTYTVWLRGYASNAAGDSAYVRLGQQAVAVSGLEPGQWQWTSRRMGAAANITATLVVSTSGLYPINVQMREDGLRIDRLLLTTDTTYIPTGFGPAETPRQAAGVPGPLTVVDRTISYDYDSLYRLTSAAYSTRSAGSGPAGESYAYTYDPVGNRLQQIINGDTTDYLYDAANRLETVNGQSYTFDANGNLLQTGVMTNSWDAANRLIETERDGTILEPIYNGVGDRVRQTVGVTTTDFALDVQGLPEVVYTGEGNAYLHLPGVIMTENGSGEVRYLLSDGLGLVRQAVDETSAVIAYNEFDPYGNPVENGSEPYGFSGEWWDEVGLLHLRARWYAPETGTFLSRDPVESEPAYQYVRGNPVNRIDPSGLAGAPPLQHSSQSKFPDYCRNHISKILYALCVLGFYGVEPTTNPPDTSKIEGSQGCFSGPIPYKGPGYLEGAGISIVRQRSGREIVYDFASMESHVFAYKGWGWSDTFYFGGGASQYTGFVYGFGSERASDANPDVGIIKEYEGPSSFTTMGLAEPFFRVIGIIKPASIGAGLTHFSSPGGKIQGISWYVGVSAALIDPVPPAEADIGELNYVPVGSMPKRYGDANTGVDTTSLMKDIVFGTRSPWPNWSSFILLPNTISSRSAAVHLALHYAWVYSGINISSKLQ